MDSSILALNPSDLVKWCRARKEAMNLSNAEISARTQVPPGTVDRILTGTYTEFKYSSIQPIVAFLIGYQEPIPKLDEIKDQDQEEFYYNALKGYKMVVQNKNHQINEFNTEFDKLQERVKELEAIIAKKDEELEKNHILLSKMQDSIDALIKKL